MPTPIEIAVALAIVLILLSNNWGTLPPTACAHLKAQWGPVRSMWDAYRLWFAGC